MNEGCVGAKRSITARCRSMRGRIYRRAYALATCRCQRNVVCVSRQKHIVNHYILVTYGMVKLNCVPEILLRLTHTHLLLACPLSSALTASTRTRIRGVCS